MRSDSVFYLLAIMAMIPLERVSAHHSPAQYDQSKIVQKEAAVIRFEFRNPHSYLHVRDSDDAEWMLETSSAVRLRREGWNKDLFAPGDQISFRASANSDPQKNRLYLNSVTTSTGETFSLVEGGDGSSEPAPPTIAISLDGVWQVDAGKLFSSPNPTENHPLTSKGRQARSAFDETMDPVAECIAWPTPFLLVVSYIYPMKIEVSDEMVVFQHEFYNTTRTIFLDGRNHPADMARTNQGHSVGYWDDKTLVVDTRFFADHRNPMSSGVPSGAERHVVERFSLSEDGTQLTVDVVVEDPEYMAEPMSLQIPLVYAPDLEIQNFECDPEIAMRYTE
ncbi:MAG: DUF6152 family protein [Gammaproteobacteria bacterium]|nr:DUF6152 family protein [Gammaproteobacteria bacterium]